MTLGQIKYFMNEPLLINSCAKCVVNVTNKLKRKESKRRI